MNKDSSDSIFTSDLQPGFNYKSYLHLIPLAIIILFVIVIRIRLLEFPLERDEGGFAYIGRLILNGELPYRDAYDFKPPGLYITYALIMSLLGDTTEGIHLGLLIVNVASVILLFFISQKVSNTYCAIFSSASYAILSLSSSVVGFAAHATHFVILYALLAALLFLRASEKDGLSIFFWSGLVGGCAFLMKQPGICFSVLPVACLVVYEILGRAYDFKKFVIRVGILLVGIIIPFGATVLIMLLLGIFDHYWFWNFKYGGLFAEKINLRYVIPIFISNFQHAVNGFYLLWALAGLGFIALISQRGFDSNKIFINCFLFLSIIAVNIGFHFREHYFIMILPALSLLVGICLYRLKTFIETKFKQSFLKIIPVGIFLVCAGIGIFEQKSYFFPSDFVELSRLTYGRNPFPESLEIANFIKSRTSRQDKIAVIGSEPQIYFYSERKAATKFLFTYFFMENHSYSLEMQKEFTEEIEQNKPRMIVYANIPPSWLRTSESESYVFTWFNDFIMREYELVGVVDIPSKTKTVYKWDSEAKRYNPQSQYNLYIFERKLHS